MLLLSLSLAPSNARQTQENNTSASSVEMADTFRQEGKIYVVVAVILLIFGGFIIYVISIDKKVSRLEKELDMHEE